MKIRIRIDYVPNIHRIVWGFIIQKKWVEKESKSVV